MMRGEDQLSRLIHDLCALLLTILRAPHLAIPSSSAPAAASPVPRRRQRSAASPAALASMLLGASLALMLSGTVTFVIGFILMPWVLSVVVFFYFLGFLSNLSGLGRASLTPAATSPADGQSPKEMSSGSTIFQTCDYMKWQLLNE